MHTNTNAHTHNVCLAHATDKLKLIKIRPKTMANGTGSDKDFTHV